MAIQPEQFLNTLSMIEKEEAGEKYKIYFYQEFANQLVDANQNLNEDVWKTLLKK